MRKVIQRN